MGTSARTIKNCEKHYAKSGILAVKVPRRGPQNARSPARPLALLPGRWSPTGTPGSIPCPPQEMGFAGGQSPGQDPRCRRGLASPSEEGVASAAPGRRFPRDLPVGICFLDRGGTLSASHVGCAIRCRQPRFSFRERASSPPLLAPQLMLAEGHLTYF